MATRKKKPTPARNAKGRFVKGRGAKSNPPKKAAKKRGKKPAAGVKTYAMVVAPTAVATKKRKSRAKSNPPAELALSPTRQALALAGAAGVGGALAGGATAVLNRFVPASAHDVLSVLVPLGMGALYLQLDREEAGALAAGAWGVAGIQAARALWNLGEAATNPPPAYYFEDHRSALSNPPGPALMSAIPSSAQQDRSNREIVAKLLAAS